MAQLAIKGHASRHKEVIKLLERLGGKNDNSCYGGFINRIYFINENGYIESCDRMDHLDYLQLTVEEFLENFPYKVGDKVLYHGCKAHITSMRWDGKEIIYIVNYNDALWEANMLSLQPYKEETMEERKYADLRLNVDQDDKLATEATIDGVYAYNEINCYHQDFGDKVRIRLGNDFEINIEDNVTYIVKKQPQYPKTYEECHELMVQWLGCDCNPNSELILCDVPIHDFCKLIVARNIYWKIAGEQMGLGKPWEPAIQDTIWGITRSKDEVEKYSCRYGRTRLLEFPTAEMRDAFYENFKDLIEQCKEVL